MSLVSPIATRTLEWAGADLRVVIFHPVPDGDDYRCEFSIQGSSLDVHGRAIGIDSVQALQLAMVRVGTQLERLSTAGHGGLMWLGEPSPTGGFG